MSKLEILKDMVEKHTGVESKADNQTEALEELMGAEFGGDSDDAGNNTVDMSAYFSAKPGKITLTWDGVAGDEDTFQTLSVIYHKISDLVPAFESITSADVHRNGGAIQSNITQGDGCYYVGAGVGDAVVVTKAGECTKNGVTFNAPSTGIYMAITNTASYYASKLVLNCDVPNSALLLNNSAGKPYMISIDDTGNITATEVTA